MKRPVEPGEGVITERGWPAERSLMEEHGALMRQIGRLQRHSGNLQLAATKREAELTAENLRLRVQLMLLRTSMFWGLGAAAYIGNGPQRHPLTPPPVDRRAPEAQEVICQTGCAGHAHPWLAQDGQCLRSGDACRLDTETRALSVPDGRRP